MKNYSLISQPWFSSMFSAIEKCLFISLWTKYTLWNTLLSTLKGSSPTLQHTSGLKEKKSLIAFLFSYIVMLNVWHILIHQKICQVHAGNNFWYSLWWWNAILMMELMILKSLFFKKNINAFWTMKQQGVYCVLYQILITQQKDEVVSFPLFMPPFH